MQYFVHPQGICESDNVGEGSRIWAFSHVLPNAKIGKECNICDHVFIENDVSIGDRVTIKSGVQIWDGISLENDTFVGPNVTFSNDEFPRSRKIPAEFSRTTIQQGASIGANATILPGIVIGPNAMVGAGSVVTRNVPASAIVVGNPARITGYEGTKDKVQGVVEKNSPGSQIHGVGLCEIPSFRDLRGSLSAMEFNKDLPFVPQRCFIVYAVPGKDVRGEHAHHKCEQFLIATAGSVNVVTEDQTSRQEFVLENPSTGLYIPPLVWASQYKFTHDAVLMVLASMPYDSEDYIRKYEEFRTVII